MTTWLERNWMDGIEELFWLPLTTFGYRHIDDVPAYYVVKYINIVPSPGGLVWFQDLLTAMADSLDGDVYLLSNITKVTYGSKFNEVQLFGGQKVESQCCLPFSE